VTGLQELFRDGCVPSNVQRRINSRRCKRAPVIKTVKKIINEEMDAVVEELKEESADVTERSVLGPVIDDVQEKVQVTAPVFYDCSGWSSVSPRASRTLDQDL
jgi:uncharacterized protein YoxC